MDKIAYADPSLSSPETLRISSDAFTHESAIPPRFTEDGAKVSPPLRFTDVPAEARSLALIVEDADSPTPAPLCHALVWAIGPDDGGFPEAALDGEATPSARRDALLGKNSFMRGGWLPPDPPTGHGPHRYCFQLFALDAVLELQEGAGRGAFLKALAGHVIARGMLIGTYERTR